MAEHSYCIVSEFLPGTITQYTTTVYPSVFQLPLKMLKYTSIPRSDTTPAVNAFAPEPQFTIDTKATFTKEVKRNYSAACLQKTLN